MIAAVKLYEIPFYEVLCCKNSLEFFEVSQSSDNKYSTDYDDLCNGIAKVSFFM